MSEQLNKAKVTEETLRARERELSTYKERMMDLEQSKAGLEADKELQQDTVSNARSR